MATLGGFDAYPGDPDDGPEPYCRQHPLGCPKRGGPDLYPQVSERSVTGRMDMAPAPAADPLPLTRNEAIRQETKLRRRRIGR